MDNISMIVNLMQVKNALDKLAIISDEDTIIKITAAKNILQHIIQSLNKPEEPKNADEKNGGEADGDTAKTGE